MKSTRALDPEGMRYFIWRLVQSLLDDLFPQSLSPTAQAGNDTMDMWSAECQKFSMALQLHRKSSEK